MNRPLISIITYGRNDGYAPSYAKKVNRATTVLAGQLERAGIDAEIVFSEWNPPADRPPIKAAIDWGKHLGVKIVTVPGHIDAQLPANRGKSVATVLSDFGKGGMFVGQGAVKAGLADRVGTFEGVLAELSAGVGSLLLAVTVAVSLMTVPPAVAASTATTNVNTAVLLANVAIVQVTVPPAPTAGVVHDQPATEESETNVVPAGSASDNDTDAALLGPALANEIV